MRCAWKELIEILPMRYRQDVDMLGKDTLQELRLRIGRKPLLITAEGNVTLNERVNREDLAFVVNTASKYSPWAALGISQGYITAKGGHRIGICGDTVMKDGEIQSIKHISSLCIRVARDFYGIAESAASLAGNILIIGPPGSGKTTFLRDLIRQKAAMQFGQIGVIDEREEIFPFGAGDHVDVLAGCQKVLGIPMILRTMGPAIIAVDEITAEGDCHALVQAAWCGVNVLATAHAADLRDLRGRAVYKPILECGLFEHAIVLKKDKTFRVERICL